MMSSLWFIFLTFVAVLVSASYPNHKYGTCTHAIYSELTNEAFCDFWYITQTDKPNELQLCDCKQNNDKYCTSWICASISNYNFSTTQQNHQQLLNKLLLPNNIDIFGVEQCGYFTDDILVSNNDTIEQYCYKYDDFQSCFCIPQYDIDDCSQWICHQYANVAKDDFSLDKDYLNQNNITSLTDMSELSTIMSDEEYECTHLVFDNDTEICTKWKGTLVEFEGSFDAMTCFAQSLNDNADIFTSYKDNITMDDLIGTVVYKWQCNQTAMSTDDFCRLCAANDSEIICDSVTDICNVLVITVDKQNEIMIIIASVCGAVVCILCVIALVWIKKKCVRGSYGFDSGYELAKV